MLKKWNADSADFTQQPKRDWHPKKASLFAFNNKHNTSAPAKQRY